MTLGNLRVQYEHVLLVRVLIPSPDSISQGQLSLLSLVDVPVCEQRKRGTIKLGVSHMFQWVLTLFGEELSQGARTAAHAAVRTTTRVCGPVESGVLPSTRVPRPSLPGAVLGHGTAVHLG